MGYHLLVLVHGLWGNTSHFDYIARELEKRSNETSKGNEPFLVVYRTHWNEGYKTLDGIDICGLRVAHEIMEQINQLNGSGTGRTVTRFSIAGYSLGGLIARYAVGVLLRQGCFDTIEPVQFTTFCTPHVGVLTPGHNISVKLFNSIVPNVLSLSGKQMFLKDFSGNQGPLLLLMASPGSVFYKALEAFQYKTLYANAINDKRTSWWTSGIAIVDPFITINETSSLKELSFKFVKGYEPIVIDANAKIVVSNKKIKSTSITDTTTEQLVAPTSNFWERKWRWVVVACNILVFAPLWVVWFIISNLMETFKSHRRINSTARDHSHFLTSLTEFMTDEKVILDDVNNNIGDDNNDGVTSSAASIRSIVSSSALEHNVQQSLHDQADTLMESVWDAMTSKDEQEAAEIAQYDIKQHSSTGSDTGSYNGATNEQQELLHQSDSEEDEETTLSTTINALSYFSKTSRLEQHKVLQPFILPLNSLQLEIIKNLNELKWDKYPILIRHTKSTHSAAIVRNIDEEQLFEGKLVVKHWLDNMFKNLQQIS